MAWNLGIDPGRSGAAVALAPDGYAEVLWSWRTGDHGLLVRIAQLTQAGIEVRVVRVRSPHALGILLVSGMVAVAGAEPVRLACEHVHVGKNAATGIQQALWLGRVLGPLEDTLEQAATLLRPSVWRKAVGVDVRLRGKAVKADAVRVVGATVHGMTELVEALGRRSVLAHDYEAGGIAWAARDGSPT